MNVFWILGGIFCALIAVGHDTKGIELFLKPAQSATEAQPEVRTIMTFIWFFVSIVMVSSAGLMLLMGFAVLQPVPLVGWFLGIQLGLISLLHLTLALRSGIERAPLKLFQWILFGVTAAFILLGASS